MSVNNTFSYDVHTSHCDNGEGLGECQSQGTQIMPFPIAYLSEHIVIVSKQAGVSFHQTPDGPGFVQQFRESLPEVAPELTGRLYPVHRLDAVTSGLVVFARTKDVARTLSQSFAQGRVEKRYIAISERKPSKKQGMIAGDMSRSRRGTWKLQRTQENPAKTKFCSISLAARTPGLRMFLLRPITGRTHQLRVAMKSLGSPILGDALYSKSEEAARCDRAYLHACALSFQLYGEEIEVISPPTHGIEFTSEVFLAAWDDLGDILAVL